MDTRLTNQCLSGQMETSNLMGTQERLRLCDGTLHKSLRNMVLDFANAHGLLIPELQSLLQDIIDNCPAWSKVPSSKEAIFEPNWNR